MMMFIIQNNFSDILIGKWLALGNPSYYYDTEEYSHWEVSYDTRTISKVNFSSGENISFYYKTRMLGNYSDELDSIVFKNQNGDAYNVVSFERNNNQLTRISITGQGDYEFSYDQQQVELSDHTQVDHIGLFNGNQNASTHPNIWLTPIVVNGALKRMGTPLIVGDADKTFDPLKSQSRILRSIIYPTGGQSNFSYELHSYNVIGKGTQCGLGLRVSQIDTYDPESNTTMSKSYKYGKGESGIGNLTYPLYKEEKGFIKSYLRQLRHVDIHPSVASISNYRERKILQSPRGPISEPQIWYDEVTEYFNNNQGKVIYQYDYSPNVYSDYGSGDYYLPGSTNNYEDGSYEKFAETMQNIGVSPRLKYKYTYDSNNDTLQIVENEYINIRQEPISGIMVSTKGIGYVDGAITNYRNTYLTGGFDLLMSSSYSIILNEFKVSKTVQTDFFGTDAIQTVTNYTYDQNNPYNISSKSILNSSGEMITEHYYYPVGDVIPDINELSIEQQNAVTLLAKKNRVTPLVEKITKKNGTVLEKNLVGFKNFGDTNNFILEPQEIKTSIGVSDFETQFLFNEYDDKGNVLSYQKYNDVSTNYIWGYNQTYPVIKIVNPPANVEVLLANALSDLESNLANMDNIANNTVQQQTWASYNESIRASLSSFKTTEFWTYTYKPSVGITSKTDPNGKAVFYSYNTDNKLEVIKDNEGNIVSRNEYNYAPSGTYIPIVPPAYTGCTDCGGGQTLIEPLTYGVNPTVIDFGVTAAGGSVVREVIITNTTVGQYTTEPVEITEINCLPGFRVEIPNSYISKDAPVTMKVFFEPDIYGGYYAEDIEIVSDNAVGPTIISVSGEGIDSEGTNPVFKFYDDSIEITGAIGFGSSPSNEDTYKTIQLYNANNVGVTLTWISIDNDTWNSFSVENEITSNVYIPPGETHNITLKFMRNMSAGELNAILKIDSTPIMGNNTIELKGIKID
ncbi:hypothetical protein [Saccharicrinis sp. GN24d3]|uniref:hypothetical protein n=1 Tax=Saccharicrinis sp. GN24d3 TaxID=3458416 RepID=UPI004036B623